jgi:dTDP-4-dehydrorhamnose reductase
LTRVIVLGASGLVGSRVSELWSEHFDVLAPTHAELDVLDDAALTAFVAASGAYAVLNCIAAADVDGCEREAGNARGSVYQINVDYAGRLAELCGRFACHLVHISTDYVFDGEKTGAPYLENDPTRALCWYAETKLRGEVAVAQANPRACVARIEMPFAAAAHPKRDLARTVAARLREGQTVRGVTDQRITPVFLDDAASAVRRIVDERFEGVIHVAAASWTTPFELACGVADRLGLSRELIEPTSFAEFAPTRPALRPRHSWLDVGRFTRAFGEGILRSVDDQLDTWARTSVS